MKWLNIEKFFFDNGDPIEEEKRMVSSIQRLVGIHNMFLDKDRSFTLMSVVAMVLFGGTFVYVGTLSQLVYLIQVLPDKLETFKALNCLSATSVPISKYIFMWTARSRLRSVFDMSRVGLSSIPPDSGAHKQMLKTLKKARYGSWLVVCNQSMAHIVYLLVPFLFTLLTNDRYLPTTPGDSFGLSPKYQTPFYEITFVTTTIATAFSAINQTGYIVQFVILLAHELGHFYAITETLNEIQKVLALTNENELTNNFEKELTDASKTTTKLEDLNNIDVKLKFCIKHHQFLIAFHNRIRELYKVVFGAHFLMMTVVLVTTLQTLNAWDVRNTIITGITGILPLFIYCFGGELLISAGNEMSTAIYACGWELMDAKRAKIVLLLLVISQRPLCLTAADIFIMNRETFGNVVQIVYKIYAVFN